MVIEEAQVNCILDFVSCGCNRTTQVLDWGRNDLIAYGGCNSIFIYNQKINTACGQVISILNGHKDRVNCVQWMFGENSEEIISGSTDHSIIVWQKQGTNWVTRQQLQGHKNAIYGLASIVHQVENQQEISLIASASSDSTMKIWQRIDNSDFSCTQELTFGNGFVQSVAMTILPSNKGVILACGCDDTNIRLFGLKNSQFEQVLYLTGHEDWVRSLAFTRTAGNDDLLLASSSQDTYIRLWRISSASNASSDNTRELTLEDESFVSADEKFSVVLESVLIGHEGWVLGVSWSPFQNNIPSLLSASMDKTMILWTYDEENQVWIDKARMGDVGGITLGYYGCAFGPSSKEIISYGYHGAFRVWIHDETNDQWKSCVTVSGHFGEVEDFDWEPSGGFVITASTDQTTRVFAQWKRSFYKSTWHEIARPQVHGYDMKCMAMLGRYKYASGAQEKVVRVFAAPKAFHDSLLHISQIQGEQKNHEEVIESLPLGATVPVLGLSNKAVYESDIKSWSENNEKHEQPMKASAFSNEDPVPFNPSPINEPPVEDLLVQNTLWPEVQKLYGHGFEIFTMASSPSGDVLATACKASKADYANIIIWDTVTWAQKDNLSVHTLTVTQLSFSPCGSYLLSVSRDRTWALHKKDSANSYCFKLMQKTDKKTSVHSRIIWACSWSHDSKYFITASRDKTALAWSYKTDTQCWSVQGNQLDMGEPITAVSIAPSMTANGKYIVSLGLESGGLSIYTYDDRHSSCWKQVIKVPKSLSPTLTVKRLRWKPVNHLSELEDDLSLGVCSSDHSFRIIKFSKTCFT